MNTAVAFKKLKAPTAKQFVALREELKFTQPQMCQYLQISKRALQYYESGERAVPEWLTYRLIRMKHWKEN